MKKRILTILVFCYSYFLFSQESQFIRDFRDKIIFNVNKIELLKEDILDSRIIDNTSDLEGLKIAGLQNIFFFDNKQIMYKEVRLTNLEMPIPIVHKDFLNLPIIKQTKIFLGELFIYKNEVYYLIGIKNDKKYSMMLFKLGKIESEKKYALINAKREVFFNNGYAIAEIEDNLNQEKNIFKFKFFPNHKIYFFMEE